MSVCALPDPNHGSTGSTCTRVEQLAWTVDASTGEADRATVHLTPALSVLEREFPHLMQLPLVYW